MEIGVEDSRMGLFTCKLGGFLSATLLIITLDRKYDNLSMPTQKCAMSPPETLEIFN